MMGGEEHPPGCGAAVVCDVLQRNVSLSRPASPVRYRCVSKVRTVGPVVLKQPIGG